MAINVSVAKINNSVNSAKCSETSRGLQNNGHNNNNPAFRGKVWEIKNKNLAENIKRLGDDFPSWGQRLISGVTAIVTQPFFDLNNKKVDEETRSVSCARTMGKIIAGTLTGVSVRWACVELTKKFTQNEATEAELLRKGKKTKEQIITNFSKIEQCLLPKNKDMTIRQIKKYRGALGTFAAVGVMIATNFLIDAPLTTYLTNKFVKSSKENAPEKSVIKGGK